MEKRPATTAKTDTVTLVKEIIGDAETLVGQQFDLLRVELGEDLKEAKQAAIALGAGAGLVASGGILTALMLVHALQRGTRLPLWICYGIVGGLLGVSGAALLAAGRKEAAGIKLWPPPKSAAALKENLQWLKEQIA